MIHVTKDFEVLKDKKHIYIYGAKQIAYKLYPVLKNAGYRVNGFIVSNPANNPLFLYDLPVQGIQSLKNLHDDIYIIIGVLPKYQKEIVDLLLNLGFYHVICLSDAYIGYLGDRWLWDRMKFFDGTDYMMYISDEVEKYHAIICDRLNTHRIKLRTENGWWLEQLEANIHKSDLYMHNLTDRFENKWGAYKEIKEIDVFSRESNGLELSEVCSLYAVRCHMDKPVNLEIPSYIRTIQAGADLTNVRIADIADNAGENISDRNRDFSECSAIYWVWKNGEKKLYTGFYHYRRHLLASKEQLEQQISDDVDLINTIPCIMYPSIKFFFMKNFFYDRDWELIIEAVQKLYPYYYASVVSLSNDNFYLANNIFIMKTKWFEKMCGFVFDVLLYIDNFYREKGFVRQDRYAGYIFEFLYSVFVLRHAKELNIVYADMKFLE